MTPEVTMETNLTEIECRVLGSLIEKELATPEYYPLTLHSLTAACNQKSNRNPVMNLHEAEVVRTLDTLKGKHLVLTAADAGRVPKYRHLLYEKLKLEPAELAVMAELLLRGPQTVGELRGRAERMAACEGATSIEDLLQELAERELVTRLPRRPGMKEQRYAHLFSGEPAAEEDASASPEPARLRVMAEDERFSTLEEEVRLLREEAAKLRKELQEFKAQFE
jgi:uncharacterized protein YceH (UPF0502 family)